MLVNTNEASAMRRMIRLIDDFMGGLVRYETLLVGYVDCFNAESQRHRDAERALRNCLFEPLG